MYFPPCGGHRQVGGGEGGAGASALFRILKGIDYYDVGVKRWLKIIRLVSMHKHLGHALAQSSLAAVLRALKTSAQVPAARNGPAVVCAY